MKTKLLFLTTLSLTLLLSCSTKKEVLPFRNTSLPIDQRVEDLISRLTPEEKVGQMMNSTPAIERLGIPPYNWWNEALHGVARAGKATVFPQAIALGATFDDKALLETFTIVSDEARAKYNQFQKEKQYEIYKGLTFWTPNINIFRDPRWGRGMETYGEDPYLTSVMGVAVVKGLQGDDPNYLKTHACAKHYAVHSGPEPERHSFDAVVTPRDLWTTYLPAFEAAVKIGNVQEVMCAYNSFEGKPCCNSDKLLVDILRNDWKYDRIILSDCSAIHDFFQPKGHHTYPDAETSSAAAVLSGTDLECGNQYKSLVQGLKDGKIKESELDVSLRRLFRGRFKLGLFDPADKVPYNKIPYSVVESKEHIAKALEMARKSMVLLQNRNNTLPLSKNIKKIAVIGPNANDTTMLWGNYNGIPSHTVTILEGIKNKMPNAEISYELGCGLYDNQKNINVDINATASKAAQSDVIIFVGGISPRLEGEEMRVNVKGFNGGDRTDLELPNIQKEMLKALKATGKPVIFVVCTGSALALNWEDANLDGILNAWYGGEEAGAAVADILFGDYNPAGRLPVTFYKSVDQLPAFKNYNMAGRTYRYMTEKPLYPFGYGLSYTTFSYKNGKLSSNSIKMSENVTVSFDIANNGKMDGDEVAQVYIRNPKDINGPIKSLKGFKRINVKAGQTTTVSFELKPEAFQTFNDATQTFDVVPGKYIVYYGSSSADKDLQSLELTIKGLN